MKKCQTCGKLYIGTERFCSIDGTKLAETELSEPRDPMLGLVVNNRYRIVEQLGEGGMSIVYRATQDALARDVAIKFLKTELAKRVGSVERFIVEARASSKVDHPNIVSVFDFGRDPDGRYYMVMEYVEGVQLIKHIRETGAFDQLRVINILQQLLSAVGAAHAAGVVHRDLKPENVICMNGPGAGERVKVLDFGLAKFLGNELKGGRLTRQGVILGTPFYMSPEQARGEPVDSRSDLYSLGVMSYEMLTGSVPFLGTSAAVILDHHIQTSPMPPSILRPDLAIHPDLELLVLTLLSKLPGLRYQTAEATLQAVAAVQKRLREAPIEPEEVLKRTRPMFERQTPYTVDNGATRLRRSSGRLGPRSLTPTTIWEAPGLLDDSSRLARLWDERIRAVADRLWGDGAWPSWVTEASDSIRSLEETIRAHEVAIATLRGEIETIEARTREAEAALRFKRLDLVSRQCLLREALAGAAAAEEPESRETLDFAEDDDTVGATLRDLEEMQKAYEELDLEINEIDQQARALAGQRRGAMEERHRGIRTNLRHVWDTRQRQVPICASLVNRVNDVAAGRPDLVEAVTALAEVAGAIQVYQAVLKAVRESSSMST
jgi:serine/threonine-protein kinase